MVFKRKYTEWGRFLFNLCMRPRCKTIKCLLDISECYRAESVCFKTLSDGIENSMDSSIAHVWSMITSCPCVKLNLGACIFTTSRGASLSSSISSVLSSSSLAILLNAVLSMGWLMFCQIHHSVLLFYQFVPWHLVGSLVLVCLLFPLHVWTSTLLLESDLWCIFLPFQYNICF